MSEGRPRRVKNAGCRETSAEAAFERSEVRLVHCIAVVFFLPEIPGIEGRFGSRKSATVTGRRRKPEFIGRPLTGARGSIKDRKEFRGFRLEKKRRG